MPPGRVITPQWGFLAGGGEMGAAMRAHDWAASPLGHPDGWPASLRAVVALTINSRYPMFIAWGPGLGFLYNDAYAPILGGRHPAALGRPFQAVWPEIFGELRPLIDRALAGQATFSENLHLVMERNGFPEDTWYSFSYSPVRDESGAVAGMFCACAETTAQVLAERTRKAELDRLALMFESAPGFITILRGPDHVFELANAAYRRLFGDRSFVGRPVKEVFPDLEDQAFFNLLDEVYQTGQRFVAEHVPITLGGPGGESLYLDFIYEPLRDAAGRTTGIFVEGHDVTRAHEAELALTESEARFRNMADHAPVMMWVTDASGACLYLNSGWYEFTGQTEAEALGLGWLDATHPEDRARAEQAFLEANAGGLPFRVEYRLRSRDGTYRWAIDAAAPRYGPAGEFLGYVGSVIDIDERREAEIRLALSEEQLRLATDAGDVGLWDVDLTTDTLFWPPRVKAMFGIAPDAPATMDDFRAGLHPEDRDVVLEAFESALDPDRRAHYDVEYRTIGKADGVVRWVAAKGRGVFNDNRVCVRALGTAVDVTARKAAEAELRELNEKLEHKVAAQTAERNRVWEMSRDLLAIMGFDGHLKAINPAWETTFGRDGETLLALSFREQVHPDDHTAVEAMMGRLLDGETVSRFEDRIRHADGSWRWISWTLVPEGELFYAVGRDVTAEKAAAAELETAQEALRQSQKMEAMGQLTGGVAHDFNNLLTPIVGSLDMLQRKGLGSERDQRLIAGAMQSAERAKTLVQRLLAFARRQPLQASAVDVGRLVEGMADLLASTTGPQVHVAVDIAEQLPLAKADANQLEMALLNLGVNARDAMPDGGTLRITARQDRIGRSQGALRPGDYIRLSVADTGSGMDDQTLARAIEPFFSTKGIGKGTGLGLSMVHGLAAQLGGELKIQSRPGVGTNVELWLPVSDQAREAVEPVIVELPAEGERGLVLLVDDEEIVRASTAAMLMDLGYRVEEAASAETALDWTRKGGRPDLLVTDHLMPGMSGVDLIDAIRGLVPDLPALVVSGYAEREGIDPLLPRLIKPFKSHELAARLADLSTAWQQP